tara:strand:- start:5925 stop:6500 length:576 start_codon:yes stop_codon:yes gene_type:complete
MQTLTISETRDGEYPDLIGLAGHKGVGKTTLAHEIGGLWSEPSRGYEILSLAKPIKKMLEVIVPKLYIYEEKEKEIPGFPEGVTARHLMQTLGTEWGRDMYPDIWLNFVEVEIFNIRQGWTDQHCYTEFPTQIIVDDIRFPNEARMIKRSGGEVWRLVREGVNSKDGHSSEQGLDEELIDKEIKLDENCMV